MDRFIVTVSEQQVRCLMTLKSNMDRFIVYADIRGDITPEHLKSNMDRFIVIEPNSQLSFKMFFKIQYG